MNDQLTPVYKSAWSERSEYKNRFGRIKIILFPFRFLDQRNQPRLAIVAITSPELKREGFPASLTAGITMHHSQLRNTWILRDEYLHELRRKSEIRRLETVNISSFVGQHDRTLGILTFASEAYWDKTRELFAIGHKTIHSPLPLVTSGDSMELSDLMVGVRTNSLPNYSFPVFPGQHFYQKDPLHLYFEIYHLQPGPGKIFQCTVEIGTVPIREKSSKKKQRKEISLEYDLELHSFRGKQNLAIDISALKAGKYELFVKIKDKISFQEKIRKSYFMVYDIGSYKPREQKFHHSK